MGVITDATGALIIGATVTVTNTGTNIGKVIRTSASGNYEANHLFPGAYRVRAETAGFKVSVRDGVRWKAGRWCESILRWRSAARQSEIQVIAAAAGHRDRNGADLRRRTAGQFRGLPR